MSIQTDLSVSPYFDDYSDQKDFYKVLFRPGVSVQARELNQLQTILQKQIERFGNHVFKQGTIIDGCDIAFHRDLKYIKVRDDQTDSNSVSENISNYVGYRVKNSAINDTLVSLEATILTVSSGFESTEPNLNTLYVRYHNTGRRQSGVNIVEQAQYNPGENLTVYDPKGPVEFVSVVRGSQRYLTTDKVVFVPAIAVQNLDGGATLPARFANNEFITNGTATAQIIGVDTTTISGSTVLRIKPVSDDLINGGDFSKWTFAAGQTIAVVANDGPSAKVSQIVGSGAAGTVNVGLSGRVSSITVTDKGSGYLVPPHVCVTSRNTSPQAVTDINDFNATASIQLAEITVAPSQFPNPVGNSFGMTVDEGIIYQKGYFTRVAQQIVIVDKYSNVPDDLSVGFETIEDTVDSNEDPSLLDNATGAPNYTAPGANRLKLTPVLKVITKAEASNRDDWLYIAEFSNGNPYKQNRQTVYNVIGKEINRRFNETAGSYVTNPFLLTTKNANTFTSEANNFNVFIDPGVALINGARVETLENYEEPIRKGNDVQLATNGNISLNFGNYVKVNNVGGYFLFKTGDRVALYNTASNYITARTGLAPATSGTLIGYARIRSLVFDSGVPGSPSAVYRLYLFDIQMNFGQNFANVRSIFYDGTIKAVCDPVLENGNAVIKDNTTSSLIYYAGNPAVVNASAISYIFRTSSEHTIGSPGTISISVPGGSEFPYTGTLASTQLRDLIVVPTANGESAITSTGNVTTTTTSNTVNGVGTFFVSEYREGDYIKAIGVGVGGTLVGQVSSIANDTVMFLTSNGAVAAAANTHRIAYPAFAPINMERDGRSATVSGDRGQITINTGAPVFVPFSCAVTYNVRQNNIAPLPKIVNRDRYVRVAMANNATGEAGPWALGVGDVFRLKKVYRGTDASVDNTDADVTQFFYIDHNQTEDYYGISYLYQRPGNTLNLTSADWLLVKFDHFTNNPGSEGLKGPGLSGTYPINDAVELGSATSTINTVEIPEVFGARGTYYDLRDQFDFRPVTNATATPSSSIASSPINPVEQTPAARFSVTDKKFPAPDSELSATINYYVGRSDRVIIDESNEFRVLAGTPGSKEAPPAPENALSINVLKIPPYPSLPYQLSPQMVEYIDTKIANEKYGTKRINAYRITTAQTDTERATNQPRGYTMADIGKLERRIAQLEYYTSLTLTELQAQKRTLLGADGTERFKFGFFVDGFEDYSFSEITNPAYSASIVDGYLSPFVEEINISTYNISEDNGSLPYVEVPFVQQTRATDGPLVADTVPTPAQIITSIVQSERNRNASDSGLVFEEFFYTFSSKSGNAEFYINSRDNNIGVEIAQATSPNGPWTKTITSQSAAAIQSADVTSKGLSTLNGGRKIEHLGSLDPKNYPDSTVFGDFLEDQLKLLWTHNPDNGIYVRVRIYKGKKHGGIFGQGRTGTFGYKLFYPVDTVVNQVESNLTTNFALSYEGIALGGRSENFIFESYVDQV